MKKKRKLKKWVIKTIIFLIIIFILTISLLILNNKKSNTINITNNYDLTSLRKIYNNNDIIAKLVIKDINLNTVITKATNNVYYLKYDAYKKPNEIGNPFIDYRNNSNLTKEPQINIYGHNLEGDNTLPFYNLTKYLNKETFTNSSDILLYLDNTVLKYEPYALKIVTEDEREHMILNPEETTIKNHLNKLLENTTYCKEDCILKETDDLLILQTCNFKPIDTYIILIAKKRGDK